MSQSISRRSFLKCAGSGASCPLCRSGEPSGAK